MAIRIIKHGKPPERNREYELLCSNCKSELLANESDGEWTPDRGREFIVFKCPVCGNSIWVPM